MLIKPHPHVVSRVVHDLALVLHHQRDEIQQLNIVGSFIWRRVLEARFTYNDILDDLVREFNVDQETAECDLNEFISLLQERELIADLSYDKMHRVEDPPSS